MLKDILRERLEVIESNGLLRKLKQSTIQSSIAGRKIQNDAGNELTSFSCNDYMGLSTHDVVKQAAIDAINLYGMGARASRLTTGNHPLYAEIEAKLASLYGTEAALVFSSGYTTNIGSISALVGRHDMILADKFIHASSLDGARLSGATIYRFTHNNVDHCMQLISKYRELHDNCLILLENIYGVDGDLAPVDEFIQLAKEWNAWVIVDTAHGFGMLSSLQADIYVGTLSKAMGALGGFVCSSKITIEYLLNKSRSFIYTTALPPAIIAAASASIDLFKSYAEIPMRLAKEFCKIMELPEPQSHIVPLIMEDVRSVILAEQALAERGILVSAIRPPTAPTPRLRLTFTAAHKLIDVHRLCNALKACVVLTEAGNWRVL